MPRISVVVPIYNVEEYLAPCLDSILAQEIGDLEVLMVDDGSTDGSAAVAGGYAARDARFKLLTQANGGLSKARNTGSDAATGEFLSFVDSDDMLTPEAYGLLLGALERTGSDFATGNVHRLTRWGTSQSPFLAKAFARTRLKTHVTEFHELLADRTAWNKLWRRSFWDAHGFRFPEGVVHEDIPVILPAHFRAASVDVIADPVYLYRIREGGALSITQRRLEERVLLDRLSAVGQVRDFLVGDGRRGELRSYDASVVADDLKYYVNVLDVADDDYRALFMERVNALLDDFDEHAFDALLAIDRLKWHLVRRRMTPELLEVLRFQREDLKETPPVRAGRHWYGDYPFREDPRRGIPRSVYRLDRELTLTAEIEDVRVEDGRLHVQGFAFIDGVGAPSRGSQKVSVTALRPGRLRRLRYLISGLRLRVSERHRPDVATKVAQQLCDVSWSGFDATLDPRRLRGRGRWHERSWELYVTVRSGSTRRHRVKFGFDPIRPLPAIELPVGDRVIAKAGARGGRLLLDVRTRWSRLHACDVVGGDTLEVSGEWHLGAGSEPRVELVSRDESSAVALRVEAGAGDRFTARVALDEIRAAEGDGGGGTATVWDLRTVADGARRPVALADGMPAANGRGGAGPLQLLRGPLGDASLVSSPPAATVTSARWTDGATLELGGRLPADSPHELVLEATATGERLAFDVAREPGGGFSARLPLGAVESLAGALPLREGTWSVRARPAGDPAEEPGVRVVVSEALSDELPLRTVAAHKPFALGTWRRGDAIVAVERDLDDDERGGYDQRRLRTGAYAARRREPLRDAVVYSSFGGRQYSDSPRALHEELVRRGAPLEHLWVVRDGACRVPETARVLREGSREYFEALATARYVVGNDHFPDWFGRRPDQTCVQTWHGTPLKRLGLDVSDARKTVRRFQRGWDRQVGNWQYVISPNRFATPILRRAYAVEGEMLETGYPRVDLLAGGDREDAGRRLRARLGLPAGKRVVLYAPTYRDQARDRRGRYRLDRSLDVERLRAAVGEDTVILFRKHHYVIDPVPVTADGFVRDVSSYPDGTELMLAADVLVTDYSSMIVDFANTGRPMLFFTYDLDAYRDEIRGFYLDFEQTVPGPLLRTADELGEALRGLDDVRSAYASRYDAFRSEFCELDDGHAAARVVDRVFAP